MSGIASCWKTWKRLEKLLWICAHYSTWKPGLKRRRWQNISTLLQRLVCLIRRTERNTDISVLLLFSAVLHTVTQSCRVSHNYRKSHGHTLIIICHTVRRNCPLLIVSPSDILPHLLLAVLGALFWLAYPYINPYLSVLMSKSNQGNKRQQIPTNQGQSRAGHAVTSQEEDTNFSQQAANIQNNIEIICAAEAAGQTEGNHLILIWMMFFFMINKMPS